MMLQRKIRFVAFLLVFGPFLAHASLLNWHDTAATAVVINKPACFIGIIHRGYYKERGTKHKTSYMYIHLDQPINIFSIGTTGDLEVTYPSGHQYDFGLAFKTDNIRYYIDGLTNDAVRVFGSIIYPPANLHTPTVSDLMISRIKVLSSTGTYRSVCHVKSSNQYGPPG